MAASKVITFIVIGFLISWITPLSASSDKPLNESVIKEAASVFDAINSIQNILEQQGFEIIGVVDHAANAASVGLDLRPTQLILFSDKSQESKLISKAQTLAIDFPLKILVWEDDNGSINHFYNDPGYLVERHRLRLNNHHLAEIAQTVRQFGELNNGLITVDSPFSVEQTIINLKDAIEGLTDKGFRIPFIIDFMSNEQHEIDYIGSTILLIFGNPNAGTPLMQNQQRIGIDLPQKFLVWEDQHGQTRITYNDIFFLAKRHNLQNVEQNLENVSNALANFVKQATQEK
ncbi:MAG: DUF302 domain-containing protein [Nitrosomonas sp.]|nr:DUF302 domain-containing protein [Nitrosomonas sp.]